MEFPYQHNAQDGYEYDGYGVGGSMPIGSSAHGMTPYYWSGRGKSGGRSHDSHGSGYPGGMGSGKGGGYERQPQLFGAHSNQYRGGQAVANSKTPPNWAPEMANDPLFPYTPQRVQARYQPVDRFY